MGAARPTGRPSDAATSSSADQACHRRARRRAAMSDQAVEPESDAASARDVVAGLLAGASVVLSAIGLGGGLLLEIGGHPGKLIPIAGLLAIIAGVMSKRFQSMALKALIFAS